MWLVAWSAQSHYLNQCWITVNPNLRNKFQWNLKWKSLISIQENPFENIVCEMAPITITCSQFHKRYHVSHQLRKLKNQLYQNVIQISQGPWGHIELISVNSLGPSDTIWWQKTGSALAQVMAFCLTAPSHYLNQCWLIITKVQWCSSEGNFAWDATAISH